MEKSYAPRVFSGRNKTDVERHERGDESILALRARIPHLHSHRPMIARTPHCSDPFPRL